jgi:hypothetical protein
LIGNVRGKLRLQDAPAGGKLQAEGWDEIRQAAERVGQANQRPAAPGPLADCQAVDLPRQARDGPRQWLDELRWHAKCLPPSAERLLFVTGRVKSVLVIDTGEVPSSVYRSLEQDGWICAHAPDVAAARLMLHEVRPALVLVRSAEESSALRQDPLLAGVPMVLLGQAPGEIEALASRLDALVAASS